ncbi:asparagine synthase (glutamine-hydrolyzing) [Paenibacillus sp. LMG 31461]|uniref:asparagine synthase (glutamine-hydrolyzing) n=1 Tax=Paenibacillus plantarum TaxID=2654975 RepID=A0ABX1X4C3_9BACL|nr:asparagine synthase (glutamine-hydrolyzing) [Paenibacillus plantarum]NOU63268.1 asparagine synthase (glutamine-hydrolyzing) [Paenibacillus plantarum]
MCGICGYFDLKDANRIDTETVHRMLKSLHHRGPDDTGYHIDRNLALGFTRLSIIDLEGGKQPLYNEDRSITLICNGEIFNFKELRVDLIEKGHSFQTNSDVEVILHLYEDHGVNFLTRLNGQFAFALYDSKKKIMFCARDQCGIAPFYYTVAQDIFIFASEIKAILLHDAVERRVDLTGLDQIMHFPGMVSPRTLFHNINSLEGGHYLLIDFENGVIDKEYWDLRYPKEGELEYIHHEKDYIEELDDLLTNAVRYRMQADVPIGFYLSGGLDSSLIAAKIHAINSGGNRHSFSIDFTDRNISESRYQRLMAKKINSIHHEILFDFDDIGKRLDKVIYHSESALKETYNTACLALSEAVRANNVKVILTGEGADELFGGYVGYRFDQMRKGKELFSSHPKEKEIRYKVWGDEEFLYEKNHHHYSEFLQSLYSDEVNAVYDDICCLNHPVINPDRIKGIDLFHKRSYIDFKLRMSDHLLSDHGDRMALANSVEARYPFLDPNVIDFARRAPVNIKLKAFKEKFILKKIAQGIVPDEIIHRPKYAFVAPGSPALLKREKELLGDILSYETIKKQGYFNPNTVEKLKNQYIQDDFKLNLPYDNDMLIIAITFGLFLKQFNI